VTDSLSDNENFVTLMQAAREDEQMRQTLRGILSQTPMQRKSLLNTWLQEMRLKNAPDALIEAVACLTDDRIAGKALAILEDL
jgi:hypothetical protein